MPTWFEDNGFASRAEARTAGYSPTTGQPVNTTQPIGQPVPLVTGAAPAAPSAGGAAPDLNTILSVFQKYPATNDGFLQAVAELDGTFGKGKWGSYLDHPSRLDKIQLPNGQTFDIMVGAGAPGASWNTRPSPEGPSAGGGPVGALGAAVGGNAMAGIDPSYQFIQDEAMKAIQRSAAAKGTLLTGGTLKALQARAGNLASMEFGNIFDRNYKLAGLGLNAAQSAAQTGSTYGGNLGQLTDSQNRVNADLITGAANARATGTATGAGLYGGSIAGIGNAVSQPIADWWQQRQGKGGGNLGQGLFGSGY